MKRSYFTILFFIKRTKLLKNGEAPICLRITVEGKRAEIQINRSIDVNNWNTPRECAIRKDAKSQELNHYLETIRTKLLRIHRELEQDEKPITAEILKKHYCGEYDKPKMLLEVFDEHNKKYRELLGKEYVKATVLRYERTAVYLTEYLKLEYKLSDIPFKNIDNLFVKNFEHYLKTSKGCAQNASVKYLRILKKIIQLAISNRWIDHNPYENIKMQQTQSNRDFLLEDELKTIMQKEFDIPRLDAVRDIFVFCAFTGLSFTDIQHLRKDHIMFDGKEYWIRKSREKTNNMCNIPLMDIPLQLIKKYEAHPICEQKGMILPVPSNQRMNSYLKEIADCCGIKKKLSTHIARHSFATIALANKVSIESIAKMLGHTDIRTTKIYARILDRTVSEEMQNFRNKFTGL